MTELAAFRQAIAAEACDRSDTDLCRTIQADHHLYVAYGATPSERRNGIGAQDTTMIRCRDSHVGGIPCGVDAGARWATMLRGADDMRRNAARAGAWSLASVQAFMGSGSLHEHVSALQDDAS